MAKRSITVLGATGSIGDSTLDLIRHHRDKYDVQVLTAGSNIEKLIALVHEFKPRYAAIANQNHYKTLQNACPDLEILSVAEAAQVDTDWTMAAIVGTAGLVPTMNAIKRGKTVAFASKECLVAAGDIMMQAVKDNSTTLLPVDSEHNAIYQVFEGQNRTAINRLILTASGGPFRTWAVEDMMNATPAQAVAHPTWTMGAKISIDSATLMNKALEIIEAKYLFNMPSERIDVVVHPQSLIHSMVEYVDGSVLSQMGPSDMKTPIAYCLGWPDRIETPGQLMDFSKISQLTFEKPDVEKFKSLKMVRDVMAQGQGACIVFNAANEIANAAFLNGRLSLGDIYSVIEYALDTIKVNNMVHNIDDVIALDNETRHIVETYISSMTQKVSNA